MTTTPPVPKPTHAPDLVWTGQGAGAGNTCGAISTASADCLAAGCRRDAAGRGRVARQGDRAGRPGRANATASRQRGVVPRIAPTPWLQSALQALGREQVAVRQLPVLARRAIIARWARSIGECVAKGTCCGGVVFCQDPGLVCCVANKMPGLRAVAVATIAQAARATLTLGGNLLAVEMPGRTFFEVRQMIRHLCAAGPRSCPDGVACTLRELDGHAHR